MCIPLQVIVDFINTPPLYRPVLDGYVMPRSYNATLLLGLQSDVPIMAGNNANELGAELGENMSLATFLNLTAQKFGVMQPAFAQLYPASTDAQADAQRMVAVFDGNRISTHLWATALKAHSTAPVFIYCWTYAAPAIGMMGGGKQLNFDFL